MVCGIDTDRASILVLRDSPMSAKAFNISLCSSLSLAMRVISSRLKAIRTSCTASRQNCWWRNLSSVIIAFGKHAVTMLCILSEKSSVTSSTLERNSSVILFSALMTACALVPLTMATVHSFLQVPPFLLLLSSFFAKRLKRMQKSDFFQANWWILRRNEYFCIYKYK